MESLLEILYWLKRKYREHVKNLSHLARDLRRTVIIDNNPFSGLLQPLNGIPCVSFTGAHSDENQLLRYSYLYWSILPLRRTCGLCYMKDFTCLHGFKNVAFQHLTGPCDLVLLLDSLCFLGVKVYLSSDAGVLGTQFG